MRQVAKCECARWPNSLRPDNLVGFCVHADIQPRLVRDELLSMIENIIKNIKPIKSELLNSCNNEEIDFLNSLEKNILETCEKYKNVACAGNIRTASRS